MTINTPRIVALALAACAGTDQGFVADGVDGMNGLACWDLDESGDCFTAVEDINGDGECSVLDCRGEDGSDGVVALDGSPGVDGIHCWDIDENYECNVDTEDQNGDGECSQIDCISANGLNGEQVHRARPEP